MSPTASAPIASQDTASLVTRLAGPSTGKAGLAKDQTEINQVIAEASKGSKFYHNEKKKDKDLTERIEKIRKLRDSKLRSADINSVEQSAERLINELESQRDLSQTIVHVDMDAFFANVELLDNPELAGKPFGVGRGVLTTASYEARKYGVRSGMPGFIAKKLCPELIFVPIHHRRYSELSATVMSILRRYDPSLLPAGCDEAYLNITLYCQTHDMSPTESVQDLRKAIFDETRLTASAGIAPTKMLAKICSDKNKPNGQYELPFDSKSVLAFLHDLPIRKVPGVGRVNERLLDSVGIKTCGDIFTHRATVYLMDKQFGSHYLFKTYLGVTSNVVRPHSRSERKSIGAERTFSPLADKDQIMEKLKDVATELENDMKQHGWTGRTITLKFKLDTFQVFTRAKSFDRWITKKEDLFATGKELLIPEFPLILRLIGLRVTKLKDLRAPAEPVGGIKYFFEPLKDKPVRNKSNTEEEEEMDVHSTANEDHLDNTEETMPGFYEMDEDDQNIVVDFSEHHAFGASHEDLETILTAESTTPPSRENTSKIPQTPPQSSRKGKSKRPLTPDEEEVHDCPICGKTLRTDNHGLNTHIDFCLSRDAIRQAQAETTSPIRASPLGLKPISKGKRKGR